MYRYNRDIDNTNKTSPVVEGILNRILKFLFGGGIFKIVALLFVFVGGILHFKEYKLSKEYVETTGIYVGFANCSDGVCEGEYTYQVDGKSYFVRPDLLSNSFPEEDTVYYNPKNPSEAMMFSNWDMLFIAGIVMFVGIELFHRKLRSLIFGNNDKNGPIKI